MSRGYYRIERSTLLLDIFKNTVHNDLSAWILLESAAAYKPSSMLVLGMPIPLEIGEYAFTLSSLAIDLNWFYKYRSKKVPNNKKVKRFINSIWEAGLIDIVHSKVFNITENVLKMLHFNAQPKVKNAQPKVKNAQLNAQHIIIIKLKNFNTLWHEENRDAQLSAQPKAKAAQPKVKNAQLTYTNKASKENTKKKKEGGLEFTLESVVESDVTKSAQEKKAPPPDSENLDSKKERELQSSLEIKQNLETFLKKTDIDQGLRNHAQASLAKINKKISKINENN